MLQASASSHQRPRKLWWLVGAVIFALFALLQMPAVWLIDKYAPDSPYIQHVSGNLWQGALVWQLPKLQAPLTGTLDWSWQPWHLLQGAIAADIDVVSGQTKLDGQVKVGRHFWQLDDINGKIAPETLSTIINWQLPNTPINVDGVMLERQHGDQDTLARFVQADGQLSWVGGELGYPSGDKLFYITMPAMSAKLNAIQKNDKDVLHINLLNNQDKRLGDLYLDGDNMLDVNLTQRLLENMPEYQGQAPQDTAVVSVRQPLLSGLGGR